MRRVRNADFVPQTPQISIPEALLGFSFKNPVNAE
jgi:hypothetical protein